MRFVKVWRGDRHTVRLQMAELLDGGVTAAWLVESLEHWIGSWREMRAAVPTRGHNDASQEIAPLRTHSVTAQHNRQPGGLEH